MSNAWNIVDTELTQFMSQYRSWIVTQTGWNCHLFDNAYTPVPGMSLGDLTEATFTGYAYAPVVNGNWAYVATATHIASTTNTTIETFTASGSMSGSATIYGYYLTDGSGTLQWAESFATPLTVTANTILTVQLVLRVQNLP